MPSETELKLSIAPAERRRIARLPLLRSHARQRARRQRILSVYYDTPDRELLRRGMILRLRRHGGRWLQTVKTARKVQGGLHQRGEYEMPVRGAKLDYAQLASMGGLTLFSKKKFTARLAPVFETDFWRTAWTLDFPDGSQVELALDAGEVRSGDQKADISEVELELKTGEPAILYRIAGEMASAVDVRLNNVSKAEMGYHLGQTAIPAATKATKLKLSPAGTVEEAFASVLWNCLDQVQANVSAVLNGQDVEGVHQMRVGLRRFRSALALFRKAVPQSITKPIREDLRLLQEPLGPVRDWDVFIGETLAPLTGGLAEQHPVRLARTAAEDVRSQHRQRLNRMLQSGDADRVLLRVACWIGGAEWRQATGPADAARLEAPLKAEAGRMLARGHRRLLRLADHLEHATDEQLHLLRIAVKEQRYALEFLRSLFPGSKKTSYRKALTDMQALLGRLHDTVTTRRLLDELGPTVDASAAALFMEGWCRHANLGGTDQLKKAWARVRKQKPFWK